MEVTEKDLKKFYEVLKSPNVPLPRIAKRTAKQACFPNSRWPCLAHFSARFARVIAVQEVVTSSGATRSVPFLGCCFPLRSWVDGRGMHGRVFDIRIAMIAR